MRSLIHYAYQQDVDLIKRRAFFSSKGFKCAVVYWCLAVSVSAIAFVLLVPWDQRPSLTIAADASMPIAVNRTGPQTG